jgi:hypothetical protein
MKKYTIPSLPNNSIPNIKQAIGVLEAPANTPIKPNPAKNAIGKFNIPDKESPKVAPT